MLYTTYLSNMKKLPANMKKYFIVRILPPGFQPGKYQNLEHMPQLSPSLPLLAKWKNHEISWDMFEMLFSRELRASTQAQQTMRRIAGEVMAGEDVVLICFEKDWRYCHRSLTADAIHNSVDGAVDWMEWQLNSGG